MNSSQYSAVRAFIVHNGKVLIIRESQKYHSPNKGAYDLPGGKLKPNESVEECLHRETREETGLTITIGKPFCTITWNPLVQNHQQHITGTIFLCTTDSPKVILSDDHDDYQWIKPEEYDHYLIIETNKPIFKTYLSLNHKN